MKKLIPWAIVAIVVFLLFELFNEKDTDVDPSMVKNQTETNIKTEPKKEPAISLEDRIKNEIIRVETILTEMNNFDNSKYRGEVHLLNREIDLFYDWARTALTPPIFNNDTLTYLWSKVPVALKNLQIKEFPLLREEYCLISNNKLWENDITVKGLGNGFTIIQFTGGVFAANANKQLFQEKLNSEFYRLRFKKTNYKWYEHDDKSTFYTINSPNDSEIITD